VQFAIDIFGGISMQVDGVTRNHVAWADWEITTHIDASPYIDAVYQAVQCHKSQLPGYGPLAESSAEEMSKWFRKGDFYRVFSTVNGGRQPETDLFDGIGQNV
jgi:LmbE family N-acetylglucosaminyl deacetylase